jgi:hypothetical protein
MGELRKIAELTDFDRLAPGQEMTTRRPEEWLAELLARARFGG